MDVWLVGGVRTPFCKAGGALDRLPAQELGRLALSELIVGKLVPYALIAFIDTGIILGAGVLKIPDLFTPVAFPHLAVYLAGGVMAGVAAFLSVLVGSGPSASNTSYTVLASLLIRPSAYASR